MSLIFRVKRRICLLWTGIALGGGSKSQLRGCERRETRESTATTDLVLADAGIVPATSLCVRQLVIRTRSRVLSQKFLFSGS